MRHAAFPQSGRSLPLHTAYSRDAQTGWRLADLRTYLAICSLLLCLCGVGSLVHAQESDSLPSNSAPMQPDGQSTLKTFDGEVKITLDKFGVGNVARRGDWFGIRIQIQDTASTQRDLVVRLVGTDADGDQPVQQRVVTANPGVSQQVWLYGRLPFKYEAGQDLRIEVFTAEESSNTLQTAGTGFRPGRLLGRSAVIPRGGSVLSPTEGIYGVLGPRAIGLSKYSTGTTVGAGNYHEFSHERTEIALGLTPADLPDRWIGLVPIDVIVWGSAEVSELRGERAESLRQWIQRGGHLVVVLPPVGQTWTNPQSNDLYDIMPVVKVDRTENADLSGFRPLLKAKDDARFPRKGTLQTFEPVVGAAAGDAMRILNSPDGKCVVVRRQVGMGAVTWIGLDLNQTAFSQFDMVDADVFWHRVLGRRGKLTALDDDGKPMANTLGGFLGGRKESNFDQDIGREIAMTGRTAAGVLIGFVVFVMYWLVAGPIAFFALKRRGQSQHAWVAYFAAGILFTAIAWGGATVLRPAKVEATHLTFIDDVYGQKVQRARLWASVLIPRYGEARLAVGDPSAATPGAAPQSRSDGIITAWEDFASDAGGGKFTDVRPYVIDTRSHGEITVPVRQTVKQIQADWSGPSRWRMPVVIGENGGAGTIERIDADKSGAQSRLTGILRHELPGTLRDVYIILVDRPHRLRPPSFDALGSEIMVSSGWIKQEWKPMEDLDLSVTTKLTESQRGQRTYFDRFVPNMDLGFQQFPGATEEKVVDIAGMSNRFTALALFSQLNPPLIGQRDVRVSDLYVAQRSASHGWDLGRWFTQPCVIVIGQLYDDNVGIESPLPLTIDGEKLETHGRTVVRWVYPLPDNPPAYPTAAEMESDRKATEQKKTNEVLDNESPLPGE